MNDMRWMCALEVGSWKLSRIESITRKKNRSYFIILVSDVVMYCSHNVQEILPQRYCVFISVRFGSLLSYCTHHITSRNWRTDDRQRKQKNMVGNSHEIVIEVARAYMNMPYTIITVTHLIKPKIRTIRCFGIFPARTVDMYDVRSTYCVCCAVEISERQYIDADWEKDHHQLVELLFRDKCHASSEACVSLWYAVIFLGLKMIKKNVAKRRRSQACAMILYYILHYYYMLDRLCTYHLPFAVFLFSQLMNDLA